MSTMGTKKLIITLNPTQESAENSVYEVMRVASMEAIRRKVILGWDEENADII